ncbi:hypothetical protein [Methylocella sp.]|uniref:hypothetical protein n=1 Tax=Methylocella sp. TaxID=1978226 RepID=UPI00378318D9
MEASDAKRLCELEAENARLKRIVGLSPSAWQCRPTQRWSLDVVSDQLAAAAGSGC